MIILGIESTAHTFGVGIVDKNKDGIRILANEKSVYTPKPGSGIHPTEAKQHHIKTADVVLEHALKKSGIEMKDVNAIAYSAGPGLPPCLLAGMEFAKKLAKKNKIKLIPVNHCIAHVEIARHFTSLKDPIVVYVSGGNTQIIGYSGKKYRVFGETLDIGIGNAIDTFIRSIDGRYPGGPILEEFAKKSRDNNSAKQNYIELPYVVKGMDLCFSGIVTAATKLFEKSIDKHDLCYSFQETIYAMLAEVTERAMAHTGKSECILTGGVAASQRLQRMLTEMCNDRGAQFATCPREYAGDNPAMIGYVGLLLFDQKSKSIKTRRINIYPRWRTDDVEITWR